MNSMKLVIPLHFISWKKRLQTMLWHHNARVNSHQRWKQTRFRVWFHLWCELTSTMNVTEWQVSWNSCAAEVRGSLSDFTDFTARFWLHEEKGFSWLQLGSYFARKDVNCNQLFKDFSEQVKIQFENASIMFRNVKNCYKNKKNCVKLIAATSSQLLFSAASYLYQLWRLSS